MYQIIWRKKKEEKPYSICYTYFKSIFGLFQVLDNSILITQLGNTSLNSKIAKVAGQVL